MAEKEFETLSNKHMTTGAIPYPMLDMRDEDEFCNHGADVAMDSDDSYILSHSVMSHDMPKEYEGAEQGTFNTAGNWPISQSRSGYILNDHLGIWQQQSLETPPNWTEANQYNLNLDVLDTEPLLTYSNNSKSISPARTNISIHSSITPQPFLYSGAIVPFTIAEHIKQPTQGAETPPIPSYYRHPQPWQMSTGPESISNLESHALSTSINNHTVNTLRNLIEEDTHTFPFNAPIEIEALNITVGPCPHPSCASKKIFRRQCDLNRHYRTHFRNFFCEIPDCSYTIRGSRIGFATVKDRDRHERTHNPSILCNYCGKRFSRGDNLRDHCRKVHAD